MVMKLRFSVTPMSIKSIDFKFKAFDREVVLKDVLPHALYPVPSLKEVYTFLQDGDLVPRILQGI